jgi:hypothetical protein
MVNGLRRRRYWAGIVAVRLVAAGLVLAVAQASPAPAQASGQASGQTSATYQSKFPGDPARSESEALALGYMRVVLRAEHIYKKRHDKYTDSLADLAGTGSFTKRLAQETHRGDYMASYRVHKDHAGQDGFIFTMTPTHMDSEHRSFYAEDDMVIHADDQKAADLSSPKVK